jgi:hypothetical protein
LKKYSAINQDQLAGKSYSLDKLVDFQGVLSLTLSDVDGGQVEVRFDSHFASRKIDEGDALQTLSAMRHSAGTALTMYEVDNSDFLAWYFTEKCDEPDIHSPLKHYAIATIDDIVDVISLNAPIIRII